MSETDPVDRYVILCVEDESQVLEGLVRDLRSICGTQLDVEGCSSGAEALVLAEALERERVPVPLVFADHAMPGMNGVDFLIALQERPWFRPTEKILVSGKATMDDLTRALNAGALNANVAKPWKFEDLRDTTRHMLTEYFVQHDPEHIEAMADLLEVGQLSHAFATAEQRRRSLAQQVRQLQRSFLTDVDVTDDEVEAAMIESIDRALHAPNRHTLPPGTLLLREGEPVKGIWIILEGEARLYREVEERELIFHAHTVGRIVGLLSLVLGRTAFFTCRTTTEVHAIKLSLAELDMALQTSPDLTIHFVTVLLRSLARRNRRSIEMQMEISGLNQQLAGERDQLTATLDQLKKAQTLLIETEKMATLGQMAAGVAHELNNPMAAIRRAGDFVVEDIEAIAKDHADRDTLLNVIRSSLTQPPMSTREERARRDALAAKLHDAELARRLVEVGIYQPEQYHVYFAGVSAGDHGTRLEALRHYHQLGKSLRNIQACSERITELVKSLRSYARTKNKTPETADLHVGLDETILLFGHDLREIRVERNYGSLPPVTCVAGELNQVWTNLISNAIQAMHGKGLLIIETNQPDPTHVQVRVIDDGPGIPRENQERIFEVNFTTRQGRVDFGLGIGLPICRDIVNRHRGDISVDSEPGHTCFTVTLPIHPNELPDEHATPPGVSP